MEKEIWKPVKDMPGFEISSFGRFKKLAAPSRNVSRKGCPDTKERIYAVKKCPKGYHRVVVRSGGLKKYKLIHRLVAFAFIPIVRGKHHINHIDGDKNNNHYSNLEWCTPAENNKHAVVTGLNTHTNSKIPLEQRKFIVDNLFTIGREGLSNMLNLPDRYIMRVAKIRVRGTNQIKKIGGRSKEIINIQTGETYTSKTLSNLLGVKPKYVNRMINEERAPNTSPYRYTGRFIQTQCGE